MPTRMIDNTNPGPEITNPEMELDAHQATFDGQVMQFGLNPKDHRIQPDGAAVRENIKVDDSTSGITFPTDQEAKT